MTFDNIEIEKCKFYYSKYQFTQIMYISDKVMMSDKVSLGKKKNYILYCLKGNEKVTKLNEMYDASKNKWI